MAGLADYSSAALVGMEVLVESAGLEAMAALAPLVAREPERMSGAVLNALHQLCAMDGARAKEWTQRVAAILKPVATFATVDQALALGRGVRLHHGQVDEDPRQVEQAGEPRGDEDDVKRFDPEHRGIMDGAKKNPGFTAGVRKPYRCHHAKAPAQGGKAGNDNQRLSFRSDFNRSAEFLNLRLST